jgi:hypothetical protein
MATEAAGTRFEQLLARHPEMPLELEQLLLQLASRCTSLEQSVAQAPDEDLRAVRERGIERRWAEYGGLELWQDGRPTGNQLPGG